MVKAHSTGSDGGLKMKDLLGCTVLWHIGRPRKRNITFKGQSRVGTVVPADTWKIDLKTKAIEYIGVINVLQDVLVEKLVDEGPGAWVTTTIIQPNQAYLMEALADKDQAVADKLIADIPDGPGPVSLRLGPDSVEENDEGPEEGNGAGSVDPDDEEPF